jgi:hypothetical protein
MSSYKQFLASDITIVPFEVNKSFYFEGNELTGSNVNIERYLGTNLSGGLFNPNTDPTTGQINPQYQRLIYDSIKELYYSNYLSSSYGSPATTQSLVPGVDSEGNVFIGPTNSSGRYFNYNQSTLTFEKYFPTGSNDVIGVLSIPSRLYGNYIQPKSFTWSSPSGSIFDDGEGNLILSSSNEICGQIFYPHGIAVITSDSNPKQDGYGNALYGGGVYGVGDSSLIKNFITSSNVTCSFSSSLTIWETQYKCTIRENEFNLTLNPSSTSGSDRQIYNFMTGSNFEPYVTTVGLYNENQQLLAIGKLSQPLPLSSTTDTTIIINIDR